MRGEGVPQRMRMHGFCDTGSPRRFLACFEDGFALDRASRLPAREEPFRGPLPAVVRNKHFPELVGKHDLPVFAALACANVDDFAVAIEVGHLQMGRFRYPET